MGVLQVHGKGRIRQDQSGELKRTWLVEARYFEIEEFSHVFKKSHSLIYHGQISSCTCMTSSIQQIEMS